MKRTKKLHKCLAILGVLITGMGMLVPVTMAQLETDRNTALDRSIESIEDKVGDTVVAEQGTDAVRTYITNLLEIMLPIAIALGVSVVFL